MISHPHYDDETDYVHILEMLAEEWGAVVSVKHEFGSPTYNVSLTKRVNGLLYPLHYSHRHRAEFASKHSINKAAYSAIIALSRGAKLYCDVWTTLYRENMIVIDPFNSLEKILIMRDLKGVS